MKWPLNKYKKENIMSKVYLNIGLEVDGKFNKLVQDCAADCLQLAADGLILSVIDQCVLPAVEGGEETLLVEIDLLQAVCRLDQWVEALCTVLQQDCIAYRFEDSTTGNLIGPKAEEWGGYQPEKFRLK